MLALRLQVAAGADPKAALAAAAQGSPGNLVVFGTNNGFFEDQKAAGDRCLMFRVQSNMRIPLGAHLASK